MKVLLKGPILDGTQFDTKTKELYWGVRLDRKANKNKLGHYLIKRNGKTTRITIGQLEAAVEVQKEARLAILDPELNERAILKAFRDGRPLTETALKFGVSSTKARKLADDAGIEIQQYTKRGRSVEEEKHDS